MANEKPKGEQIEVVPSFIPYIEESFDLNRLDLFVESLGTTFVHWAATPSPIGLNDKGDYRRNDQVDVMTSNGYIYNLAGRFTAVLTSNNKDQKRPGEGGLLDSAQGNLVLPRFYDVQSSDCDCVEPMAGQRIYLTPGDRLYHADKQADDLVVNKELMSFNYDAQNVPMYPIKRMLAPIIDSRGITYRENIDFSINERGNIVWLDGGNNPGIDPDTGSGRTYGIRYLYRAFYYVTSILREVRITNVTEGAVRRSERMPMFIQLTREYLYHNINNGGDLNKPPKKEMEIAQTVGIPDNIDINQGHVKVEMTDIDNEN